MFTTMPLYYFFLECGPETLADDEPEMLENDAAAHAAAEQTARELSGIQRWDKARIVVRTDDGRPVTEVPLVPGRPN